MKHSIFIRALPALTTYLTSVSIVCASSILPLEGYGRENGMATLLEADFSRFYFALKCTFKVFTLFFINWLDSHSSWCNARFLTILPQSWHPIVKYFGFPSIYTIWPPFSLFVYWTIGTLYMYWFAKYIGMIRKNIIKTRCSILYQIPEDPILRSCMIV
ncbi:AVN_HP_G0119890.mRNA.1.CDS.1 [Saccharomyces cerevisiae]|nr:AVN_HP_G0119890.mRNA.1.CDS.1 [Saccharomyces cerevisiae]CAI6996997.1 AVN_HP_G0119890.mRNA.1.CDS.1 [Saccharomyces cerevisiae]